VVVPGRTHPGAPDPEAAMEPWNRPAEARGANEPVGLASAAAATEPSAPPAPAVVSYPEWDHAEGRYVQRAVSVRLCRAAEVDGVDSWAADTLRRHAALVRQVRQRFDRLRARRTRLGAQRDGDELDLAACVRAMVDVHTGHGTDDRLYIAVRPARRGLAIALLVDVSGSTDAWVTDGAQVIDVEKVALLLASEAFDALGDLYAVLAFASHGPEDVRLTTVKDFAERNGEAVRRRIAALAPGGNTRLGAAVRHATALLARQPAGHRLLLILSDGRPNDVGRYQGSYGVEDSRQAIVEARAAGVFPFCLTVDREGHEYLSRIFGPAGHTILRHPDQLPLALLALVRQLLST
jgi:nitric oxide reductase NorD protein